MKIDFSFKPLKETDLNMMAEWFNQPHVKAGWPETSSPETTKEKYRKRIKDSIIHPFIIYFNDKPIGFIQYYHADQV